MCHRAKASIQYKEDYLVTEIRTGPGEEIYVKEILNLSIKESDDK
ncbi:hypothetical protein QNJ39_07435 [Macrococcus caseolyticus]|nr:hypothetical protein [Macrococcus caseolyticus]MDJ1091423.1 hypothetical protein [Macrococcus caseolyticus]